MAKAKIQTERKSAKPSKSEQRFTISEIEQATERGYKNGYMSAMLLMESDLRALGLLDEYKARTVARAEEVSARRF